MMVKVALPLASTVRIVLGRNLPRLPSPHSDRVIRLDVRVGFAAFDDRVVRVTCSWAGIAIARGCVDQLDRHRHGAAEGCPGNAHGQVGRDLGGIGRQRCSLGEVDAGEPFAAVLNLVVVLSGPGPHGGAARVRVHGDAGGVVTAEVGYGVERIDLAQLPSVSPSSRVRRGV